MINVDDLNAAIQAQIKETVNREVISLLTSDPDAMQELKRLAVSAFVHKITIDQAMSDLIVSRVAEEMKLFSSDEELLNQLEMNTVQALMAKFDDEQDIKSFLTDRLDVQLDKMLAPGTDFLTQLKVHSIQQLVNKIVLEENVEQIIGDKLAERFAEQFDGSVRSESQKNELSILEDAVVVENELVARTAKVVDQASVKNLTVTGDLVVMGSVDNRYPLAWSAVIEDMKTKVTEDVVTNTKDEMVAAVLQRADELAFTDIKLDGKTVLKGNRLNNQITESNLLKVGQLRDLEVLGNVDLTNTLHVTNKRVGINTDSPTCGLDVWDGEVEMIMGKLELQTGFVGTARSQTLKLGVNSIGHLTIDNTGMVRVEKFQIGERRIAFGSSVPGWQGKPGELVFNTQFNTTDRIFAWVCRNDFSWIPLKAEI